MTGTPTPSSDLTAAIHATVAEFVDNHNDIQDAVSINSGYCRWFADRVLERLEHPDDVSRIDAWDVHTWLVHDGQHYDAEHPDGVSDPHDFPLWKRLCDDRLAVAADDCRVLTKQELTSF